MRYCDAITQFFIFSLFLEVNKSNWKSLRPGDFPMSGSVSAVR